MRKSTYIKFFGLLSLLIVGSVWAANNFPNLITDQFHVTGATATTVPYFDANKKLVSSSTTPTQLGLLGTATNLATPSTLVERDASGNFLANIITSSLIGNVTGNVTGNADTATKWANARLLAGNSTDGSTNVPFSNKFVVQGTTDSGLSSAQFLGALGTGIVKNTTTTGVLSIAVAGDFPTLNQNTSGNANTATSLAANPTDCGANTWATTIDAQGNLTCSAVSATAGLSGVVPIANGGTNNGSLAVTAGGTLYTDGSKLVNVGAGSTGQVLTSNGSSAPAWAAASGGGSAGINVLSGKNNNAELGATTNWTASAGTFTVTSTAANVGNGTYAFSWDASATSQTVTSDAQTIPAGLFGANCLLEFYYKGFDSNITAQVWDGSTVVASKVLSASTNYTRSQLNFICPSSGTMAMRLSSSADAAIGFWDEAYLGNATNISNISQAKFIGSAYFATTASCTWARATTTIGSFGTTAACPGPTVDLNPGPGVIQTTDVDLPKVTINNLGPGYYKACFTGSAQSSTTMQAVFVITDGTTQSPIQTGAPGAGVSADQGFHVCGWWNYTTAGNHTFELQAAADNGTITVSNQDKLRRTGFYIEMFPSGQDQAVTAATSAQSWSGYHDSTCAWSTTSTSPVDPTGDATCAFGTYSSSNLSVSSTSDGTGPQPGITFTATTGATYLVCAMPFIGNTSGYAKAQLTDGTTILNYSSKDGPNSAPFTICGTVTEGAGTKTIKLQLATSAGQTTTIGGTGVTTAPATNAINWSVVKISQQMPEPILVNSVVTPLNGVTRIVWGQVSGGGTNGTCNSSPCTLSHSTGVTSVTRTGLANYTVNFATAYTDAPSCNFTAMSNNSSNGTSMIYANAGFPTTTQAFAHESTNSADASFTFICVGQN